MITFLLWIAVGALVGWLASLMMKTDGAQGALLNIIIGIAGAFVGGMLFRALGLPGSNINEGFSIYSVFVSVIGAVVVIIALLLVIGIPTGFLTAEIKERVERETGHRLAINGGARIGLWPSLNITLNDVTLQDPKDRDINNRFAASSIQADVTLASVWAGKPRITELVVTRPVVNLPLRRERLREANTASPPAATKAPEAFSIEHVSVTGGTIVLSNLRDRVESVGGTLTTESLPGAGTQVRVRLPLPTVATAGSE